jgi:uncharacterized phage-associated protein
MVTDGHVERDLLALMAIADNEIDTTDISETIRPSSAMIGKYSGLASRNYDVRAIANWCLRKAKLADLEPTNMWLNKLVYFIYEKALREFHVLLTPARVEAWDHGPVFREIYSNFLRRNSSGLFEYYNVRIRSRQVADEPFECVDVSIFEAVWEQYGHSSASALRNISHRNGSPWHSVWMSKGQANPGMEIDIGTILGRNTDQIDGNP